MTGLTASSLPAKLPRRGERGYFDRWQARNTKHRWWHPASTDALATIKAATIATHGTVLWVRLSDGHRRREGDKRCAGWRRWRRVWTGCCAAVAVRHPTASGGMGQRRRTRGAFWRKDEGRRWRQFGQRQRWLGLELRGWRRGTGGHDAELGMEGAEDR
jgi:hypothetical protein